MRGISSVIFAEYYIDFLFLWNVQKWEPLSSQQRQAASIVEVFRIIEEVCIIAKTRVHIWLN